MTKKKKKSRFNELRRELKRLGVSVDDLIKRCGLSSSMAYSIMNGGKLPSMKTVKCIGKKLNFGSFEFIEFWLFDFYKTSKENRELAKFISRYQHFE